MDIWLGVLVRHVQVIRGLRLVGGSLFACRVGFQAAELGERAKEGESLELQANLVVYLALADHGPFCHTFKFS